MSVLNARKIIIYPTLNAIKFKLRLTELIMKTAMKYTKTPIHWFKVAEHVNHITK